MRLVRETLRVIRFTRIGLVSRLRPTGFLPPNSRSQFVETSSLVHSNSQPFVSPFDSLQVGRSRAAGRIVPIRPSILNSAVSWPAYRHCSNRKSFSAVYSQSRRKVGSFNSQNSNRLVWTCNPPSYAACIHGASADCFFELIPLPVNPEIFYYKNKIEHLSCWLV